MGTGNKTLQASKIGFRLEAQLFILLRAMQISIPVGGTDAWSGAYDPLVDVHQIEEWFTRNVSGPGVSSDSSKKATKLALQLMCLLQNESSVELLELSDEALKEKQNEFARAFINGFAQVYNRVKDREAYKPPTTDEEPWNVLFSENFLSGPFHYYFVKPSAFQGLLSDFPGLNALIPLFLTNPYFSRGTFELGIRFDVPNNISDLRNSPLSTEDTELIFESLDYDTAGKLLEIFTGTHGTMATMSLGDTSKPHPYARKMPGEGYYSGLDEQYQVLERKLNGIFYGKEEQGGIGEAIISVLFAPEQVLDKEAKIKLFSDNFLKIAPPYYTEVAETLRKPLKKSDPELQTLRNELAEKVEYLREELTIMTLSISNIEKLLLKIKSGVDAEAWSDLAKDVNVAVRKLVWLTGSYLPGNMEEANNPENVKKIELKLKENYVIDRLLAALTDPEKSPEDAVKAMCDVMNDSETKILLDESKKGISWLQRLGGSNKSKSAESHAGKIIELIQKTFSKELKAAKGREASESAVTRPRSGH